MEIILALAFTLQTNDLSRITALKQQEIEAELIASRMCGHQVFQSHQACWGALQYLREIKQQVPQ